MNAEAAQGAAGFLGRAGKIELEHVTIDMKNDYGTVTVVALDDKPISRSSKILMGKPQNLACNRTIGFNELFGFPWHALRPSSLDSEVSVLTH